MRVGLSILTYAGHSIWNNGIGQNVLHLAELLKALPNVSRVVFLDCGDQKSLPPDLTGEAADYPVLSLAEAEDAVDVAIEIAGGLDAAWIARLRARGGKLIWHLCGQPYSGLIEPALFDKPGYWSDPHRADEIWILPKDAQFAPILRGVHRCPTHVVPYLWSPRLLDASAHLLTEGVFGYRPGALGAGAPARVAVFEPNISPIKNCLPPMLIADRAARLDANAVAALTLYNTKHLQGQATFDFALANLTLRQAGKVELFERDYFVRAMSTHTMVVSHQLECTQNYLYLDALHGGFPLIHNSPFFKDVGYYYPGNDLEEGARRLLHAWRTHDAGLDAYRAAAATALAALDPLAPANKDAYARRLIDVTSARRLSA